ncbi:hypothetical protein G6O69_35670 [Pseudenhygromyxa sp. WMMC2535]|uniref:hypothetical protein n=1 Tax=Pseudenhygromyxa sp. WMMC2535 TaxID=2712867 RepID=UPI001554FF00|nr:hypothetical protein [Pseudenhygromyxa sp. WMMC2535]NVB43218.1 hypothetical protein [Pseudenhygromyxa sp. WMMC2535]
MSVNKTITFLLPLALLAACSDDGAGDEVGETAGTEESGSETDTDTETESSTTTETETETDTDTETESSTETETGTDTDTDTETETDTDTDTTTGMLEPDLDALMDGLEDASCTDYVGEGDGGIAHTTYWSIVADSEEFLALPEAEQAKLSALQATQLHSLMMPPSGEVAGRECTGALVVEGDDGTRRQELVIKLPTQWNGRLVVGGSPGTRDEWSTEAIFSAWLVNQGYAYVVGNKGMTNGGVSGNDTMLSGEHPTRHWGMMLLDLADWARPRVELATAGAVERVYTIGISNGGYQVRKGLELDHLAVEQGAERRFDGGVDWEGAYWPSEIELDENEDGVVTPAELDGYQMWWLTSNERAAHIMGWPYDPDTLTNTANFELDPPFADAHEAMMAIGFDAASAPVWGAYNSTFDYLKDYGLTAYKGTGYYNVTSYLFRAELLGDDAFVAAEYSPYSDGSDEPPVFYPWLDLQVDGGWNEEAVLAALDNANSAQFSAPLITVQGLGDALLGVHGNGYAYADAVAEQGSPELYRLYVIENAGHIDRHADALLDFDFDGEFGEEGLADSLTYVQPYVEKSFELLIDWVEAGQEPPESQSVPTDPAADILSAAEVEF